MIDSAGFLMAGGKSIASERIQGVDDNMERSHYHEYFELYYLEYGNRYHMVNEHIYSIQSGELILFPPYVMHHSYGDSGVAFKRLLVYFTPDMILVPEIKKALGASSGVYRLDKKDSLLIHQLLKEILKEQDEGDGYGTEAMQMLLNQLLIKLARQSGESIKPEQSGRISEILHYLHLNYSENITLNDLAARFYISPYYLCREFKRYTNSTIIHYLNNLRIIQAQRMFLETDKTITDISREVGFSNVTHFNRVFKSLLGMSPSQNRKQLRPSLLPEQYSESKRPSSPEQSQWRI
ncbi:helix-turn-helix domain-containing protein [Bacillus velezensis]|uniref:helix-turn-helix domain-containing protein n=1 Tax=Bacillus velezensis TaxID=492670 RepID=UPI003F27CFBA